MSDATSQRPADAPAGERPPLSYEAYLARKYMPELDGLRALSVLMVVSVHMHDSYLWQWLGGWQGVSVFFVLSGYLITALSLREESQRGSLSLTAFYIRRCFRIFPLYYVTLGLYCLLILGLGINYAEKGLLLKEALPYYLLYLQEIPEFYGLPNAAGDIVKENIPFYQSWSLGIEEKFYLVWPLLLFVLWRGQKTFRFAGTLALVVGFALIHPVLSALSGPDHHLDKFGSCLEPYFRILVGCLAALLLHDRWWYDRLRFLGTRAWTWAALALFLTLHFVRPQVPGAYPALNHACNVLYALSVTVFLVGVLLGEGVVQRVLRWEPLVFVGKLSYGIYLIHILCLNVVQRLAPAQRDLPPEARRLWVSVAAYVLACALSVAVAWVLFLLVERPLIEVGRRWSKRVLDQADRQKRAGTPLPTGA